MLVWIIVNLIIEAKNFLLLHEHLLILFIFLIILLYFSIHSDITINWAWIWISHIADYDSLHFATSPIFLQEASFLFL